MTTCFSKKQLFLLSKDDFIKNIVDCSVKAKDEARKCLPDEQKWFPRFALELAKSMVNFMYDDQKILQGKYIIFFFYRFIYLLIKLAAS